MVKPVLRYVLLGIKLPLYGNFKKKPVISDLSTNQWSTQWSSSPPTLHTTQCVPWVQRQIISHLKSLFISLCIAAVGIMDSQNRPHLIPQKRPSYDLQLAEVIMTTRSLCIGLFLAVRQWVLEIRRYRGVRSCFLFAPDRNHSVENRFTKYTTPDLTSTFRKIYPESGVN